MDNPGIETGEGTIECPMKVSGLRGRFSQQKSTNTAKANQTCYTSFFDPHVLPDVGRSQELNSALDFTQVKVFTEGSAFSGLVCPPNKILSGGERPGPRP
jgi:hypothetical protein